MSNIAGSSAIVLSYSLVMRLFFNSLHIHSINLLTSRRKQVKVELLEIFICNGITRSGTTCAVQVPQLVCFNNNLRLGPLGSLMVGINLGQKIVITMRDVIILVLKKKVNRFFYYA